MAETLGMGNRIESCPLPVVFVFKIQTGIYTRQIFVLRMFVHDKFSGDIFVKYEHINYLLKNHGDFFSAADYPINPGMLKFGIKWDFFD